MEAVPDYELVESIKQRLRNAKDVIFTIHALEGLTTRPATEAEIKNLLLSPDNPIHAIAQNYPEGKRYRLYFRKSRRYDWIIVIVFEGSDIRLVSAFPQYSKRTKVQEKWRKRLHNKR